MTNQWSTWAVVITTCVASCSPAPARQASSSSSAATAQNSTATDVGSAAATAAASPKDKIAEEALASYVRELDQAGTASRCDEAEERVGKAMAVDARLSDAQLQAEIDHYETVKGPMPSPSPGTACAIFGFQKALHTALYERTQGRGPQP